MVKYAFLQTLQCAVHQHHSGGIVYHVVYIYIAQISSKLCNQICRLIVYWYKLDQLNESHNIKTKNKDTHPSFHTQLCLQYSKSQRDQQVIELKHQRSTQSVVMFCNSV